jgi:hypothetical protein
MTVPFIHSCYLYTWDKKVPFDTGSANFTIGKVLTGATSHATGLVKTVSGTTTGYLILSNVVGVFVNNETITDNNTTPGSALVNGTMIDYVDGYGKKSQTLGTAPTQCRFVNAKLPQGKIADNWSGRFPAVMFPYGVTLTEGLKLYTTAPAFTGTYTIQWPPIDSDNGAGSVDHISVGLQFLQTAVVV